MTRRHRNRTVGIALIALFAATQASAAPALFNPAPSSPITVGSRPTGVATGDFNGHGKQDIAVANANVHTVTILPGNGAGGFTAAAGSPVNGDHKLDLAVVNAVSNNFSILLGNGTGAFALDGKVSNGLFVTTACTFSKGLNYAEDTDDLATSMSVALSKGSMSHNRTHVFTQSYMWALPFGKGKRRAQSGPRNWVAGGWEIQGLFSACPAPGSRPRSPAF